MSCSIRVAGGGGDGVMRASYMDGISEFVCVFFSSFYLLVDSTELMNDNADAGDACSCYASCIHTWYM